MKSLNKNKLLKNINRIILFDYEFNDDFNIDKIINYDLNGIIAYSDTTKNTKLKNNEVIICLKKDDFINSKKYLKNRIGKEIAFKHKEKTIKLLIKDIINTERKSSIIISNDLFLNLAENNNFKYLANVTKKSKTEKIYDIYKKKSVNMFLLEDYNEKDNKIINDTEKLLNSFASANYIFVGIFIVIMVVVNKNIIFDLKDNIKLEKNVGFSNLKIKFNILKRIMFIQFISIIISLGLIYISLLLLNSHFILYLFNYNLLIIITIIFISNILLSLIVNNKSSK